MYDLLWLLSFEKAKESLVCTVKYLPITSFLDLFGLSVKSSSLWGISFLYGYSGEQFSINPFYYKNDSFYFILVLLSISISPYILFFNSIVYSTLSSVKDNEI
jgi:hypothetical protein